MEKQNKIILYTSKQECCGCGACMDICPKNAIDMCEDEFGFLYPVINDEKCIRCRMCQNVCAYQNSGVGSKPVKVYVAANTNEAQNAKSSSGGAFAALATTVLNKGGIVYGAGYLDGLKVRCVRIEDLKELAKIQGSKYVQCSMDDTYRDIKEILRSERQVLFSGTPCQVASVRRYLGKSNTNLLTVDIICHGVPCQRMLKDYLKMIDSVSELEFRDKKKGWEDFFMRYRGTFGYHRIHCRLSSYYEYFLQGMTYRDSCYSCRYANERRYSDITIGDYWGIRKSHPDLMRDQWWQNRLYDGISCVLVNTEKGKFLLEETRNLRLVESNYEKASRDNSQLRNPTPYSDERDRILSLYKSGGWKAVDCDFLHRLGIRERFKYLLKAAIPVRLKRSFKRAIR